MKMGRKMINGTDKFIIVYVACMTLLTLTGFLWFNQKPDFSKYHSYVVYNNGEAVSLTDEQFQRIIEVYENDETLYYEWFDTSGSGGYTIYLYKTTDMSGECDIMRTGGIVERHLLEIGRETSNGGYSWKAWEYEEQTTARKVIAIIDEAINEAEGE